ncbi:hypothetical protein M3Y97_00148700 [Aphelenchoides bicaudatus]|nr:hypothetical protein M3Y97_00148700 [Aphelenchoides bicaudatus]
MSEFKTQRELQLETEVAALKARLELLCRHRVYGFWLNSGEMLYTGQDTNEGRARIIQHLMIAIGRLKEGKKAFHYKLAGALKQGIYAAVIFNKLDSLPKQEREKETAEVYAKSTEVFEAFEPTDLITLENVEEKLKSEFATSSVSGVCSVCNQQKLRLNAGKCTQCHTFKFAGECERCHNTDRLLNSKSYCSSCNDTTVKAAREGKTLQSYDPTKSRINSNFDNETQRALAYSMYKRNVGGTSSATKICQILYDDIIGHTTINGWHKHFSRSNFATTDFPFTKHKILDGSLTDFAKQALIVYEHDHSSKPTVQQAVERINGLFGQNTVSLEFVQNVYDNIVEVKEILKQRPDDDKNLKRKAGDEEAVDAKKARRKK